MLLEFRIFGVARVGMQVMDVYKNNIKQFLMAPQMTFVIPVYQRNYAWEDDDCKRLWSDIHYVMEDADDTRRHFLGTICTKTINSHEKVVIDGQQRLTTVTLLMKAMHDQAQDPELRRDLDEHYLHNTGFGIQPQHRVKLHLNRQDDHVYNWLLDLDASTGPSPSDTGKIESGVYQNYRYFRGKVDGMSDEQIVALRDALERITIVDLDVGREDPQEIFDSLNSTGKKLLPVDLLRNFLLMSLDHETQLRLYNDYWYRIEENVRGVQRDANMVRFFVDYLIYTRRSDATTVRGRRAHINANNLYSAFMGHYRSISGETDRYTSSPKVTEQLLRDMYERSKTYRRLVFADDADLAKLSGTDALIYDIVVGFGSIWARPVLMYVLEGLAAGDFGEDDAQEMLQACLTLVVRAKTCKGKGFNGQFSGNVLQHIEGDDGQEPVSRLWCALTSGNGEYAFPSDKTFREQLCDRPIYEMLRADGTKYFLYSIERNTTPAKELPAFKTDTITVDHVMPQKLTSWWRTQLGQDVALHQDFLHRLGNLTLTGFNSEMSNKPFPDKARWYGKSSFDDTRSLADEDEWGLKQIMDRGAALADACLAIWPMPDEFQPKDSEDKASAQASKKRPPFSFDMVGIGVGEVVSFVEDPAKTAVVEDDKHVRYDGDLYTLSSLAARLLGTTTQTRGPAHFAYGGEVLSDMRERIEKEGQQQSVS